MAAFFTATIGITAGNPAQKIVDPADLDRIVAIKPTSGSGTIFLGFTQTEAEAQGFDIPTTVTEVAIPPATELWVWSSSPSGVRLLVTKAVCGC